MSIKLIKKITIKQDGVFLFSTCINDTAPYHSERSNKLSQVYETEGPDGLDREVVRMFKECAAPMPIKGDKYHKSIWPYVYATRSDEAFALAKKMDDKLQAFLDSIPEEQRKEVESAWVVRAEERTHNQKAYASLEAELTKRLYADMAKLADRERNFLFTEEERKSETAELKLSEQDKAMLTEMGCSEDDFEQIEDSMKSRNTQYEVYIRNNDSIPIARKTAIRILGRRTWLSGLARSAFHSTAVRETEDGHKVFFDSSQMHKD